MSKPKTVHTVESLLARTTEYGECRIWAGYSQNGSPQIFEAGRMTPVRRVLTRLLAGGDNAGGYYVSTCGEKLCVEPTHFCWISSKTHMQSMAVALSKMPSVLRIRNAKISKNRREVTDAQIAAMQADLDKSCRQVASEIGVSSSLVSRYRSGRVGRTIDKNPWAQLIGLK